MDLEEFFSVDGGTNTSNGLEHQAQDEAAARAAMLDPRELERALRRQNAQRMVECEDHCMFCFSFALLYFPFCFDSRRWCRLVSLVQCVMMYWLVFAFVDIRLSSNVLCLVDFDVVSIFLLGTTFPFLWCSH